MRAREKGFTLIELIVAMVLAALLLGALIPLLVTAQKSTYDAQKRTRAAQAGEAIYTYVAAQLRGAERVFIGHGGTAPTDPAVEQWNAITVGSDGLLKVNGVTPYPESYQEGAALTLTAQGHDRTAVDLTVRLEELYEKSSSVSLQNLLRSGFSQTEGAVGQAFSAPAAAGGEALTLYYLGGDGSVAVFPTPENPTPDNSRPAPAEDNLTVTILNKSLRVEADKTATVQAYVHVPAGKTADYQWSRSQEEYLSLNETQTPVAGTLTASGTVTMRLTADKATEENKPVSLTLKATLTGTTETKQDTCLVTVYEDNKEPNKDLELVWGSSSAAIGSIDNGDAHRCALKTEELDATQFKNGFSLTAFVVLNNGHKLNGTWEIEYSNDLLRQAVTTGQYLSIKGTPPTGTMKVRFICNGTAQDGWNGAAKYNNKWTETTITFYNWDEVEAKLTWKDGNTSKDAIYIPNAIGLETAQMTLAPQTSGMAEYCAQKLPGKTVRLSTAQNDPNAWNTSYLTTQEGTVTAAAGDTYIAVLPLNATSQRLSGNPTFTFWASLIENGTEVLGSANSVSLKLKNTSWKAPEMRFTFDDGSTSRNTTYSSGNKTASKVQLTVSVENKEQAEYLKYSDVSIVTSDKEGPLQNPPIGLSPLAIIKLTDYVEDSSDNGTLYTFQTVFDLKYLSGLEPDDKTYFFAIKLSKQPGSLSNEIQLGVKVSIKGGIVLRLGNDDSIGRIINGETIYLAKKGSNLEITAYENDTPMAKQVSGIWTTTGNILTKEHVYWLAWYRNHIEQIRQSDGISEPFINKSTSIYIDQQGRSLEKVRKTRSSSRQTIHHLVTDRVIATGDITSTFTYATTLTFTPDNGDTPISVYLTLLDEPESLKTDLYIKDKNSTLTKIVDISVGQDVGLKLETTLDEDDYSIEWQIEPEGIFKEPGMMTAGQTDVVLKSEKIPLANTTPVTVTAIWRVKGEEGEEYGRDRVTINVEPLEQHFQQYQNGVWEDIHAEAVIAKIGERTNLRVVDGDGKSLPGTWSYYDALLKKELDPSDKNVLILYADQATESPVSFTPASSKPLYQSQAITLKVVDFEIGGSDKIGGAALKLEGTAKEPISILSEEAYPGYRAAWYVRRAGEDTWREITDNGDSQVFDSQFQAKPVAKGGRTLQAEFLGKTVSAQYEIYLELVNGADIKRSQVITVTQK